MIKLFTAQKAYSLLELTVSLAIIAILLSMSTLGLLSLRESLQVNSATQGLYDSLQLARSYAINNVTYWDQGTLAPLVPTMYVISLKASGNPVDLKYCNLPNNSVIANINPSNCALITGNVFESDISGVGITGNPGSNPCSEIGFLTGTGEIFVKKSGGGSDQFLSYSNLVKQGKPSADAICQFLVKTQQSITPRSVFIEVDANAQTIKKK